jgi:hypothetical protein
MPEIRHGYTSVGVGGPFRGVLVDEEGAGEPLGRRERGGRRGLAAVDLVAESLDHIRASARKALAYVEDGDPRVNRPKPMEAFEQLPADSKECRYCAFRRLCGRG